MEWVVGFWRSGIREMERIGGEAVEFKNFLLDTLVRVPAAKAESELFTLKRMIRDVDRKGGLVDRYTRSKGINDKVAHRKVHAALWDYIERGQEDSQLDPMLLATGQDLRYEWERLDRYHREAILNLRREMLARGEDLQIRDPNTGEWEAWTPSVQERGNPTPPY